MFMNRLKDIYIYLLRRHYLFFKRRKEAYSYRGIRYSPEVIKMLYDDMISVFVFEFFTIGNLISIVPIFLRIGDMRIENISDIINDQLPQFITYGALGNIGGAIELIVHLLVIAVLKQPWVLLNHYIMARSLRRWEIQQQKRDTDPRFR